MTEQEKRKLAAAGKIAAGIFRMGSAVATATGHGMLGSALSQHNKWHVAARLGKLGFEGGQKMFREGLDDWKRAE